MKFKQIIPVALAAVILGGCTPAADTSGGIEQTAAVTTAETTVTESQTKGMYGDESKYLVQGYSLGEIGYKLVIPEGKMPTDPLSDVLPTKLEGAISDTPSGSIMENGKKRGQLGYTECHLSLFTTDIQPAISDYASSCVLVAFKKSDFDIDEKDTDLKTAFGKKLVRCCYLNGMAVGGVSEKYLSYGDLLDNYKVCDIGEYMICDVTEMYTTGGHKYGDWLKNEAGLLYKRTDAQLKWITDFREYLVENLKDNAGGFIQKI
ncbi:MAG: hypothetical protein RR540_05630 [Oscillospiraceae bacterium]